MKWFKFKKKIMKFGCTFSLNISPQNWFNSATFNSDNMWKQVTQPDALGAFSWS